MNPAIKYFLGFFHLRKIKYKFFALTLKGQSNDILDPHFFHNSNHPGPLTNELKYFRLWFRFRRDIHIFMNFPGICNPGESISPGYHTAQSQSPQGIILRRVNLPGVSYPGESFDTICVEISQGCDTRRVNLPGVSNCAESISPGYDTPGSQCKELSIRSSNCVQLILYLYNFPGRD